MGMQLVSSIDLVIEELFLLLSLLFAFNPPQFVGEEGGRWKPFWESSTPWVALSSLLGIWVLLKLTHLV